jgi:hypothetical protein
METKDRVDEDGRDEPDEQHGGRNATCFCSSVVKAAAVAM